MFSMISSSKKLHYKLSSNGAREATVPLKFIVTTGAPCKVSVTTVVSACLQTLFFSFHLPSSHLTQRCIDTISGLIRKQSGHSAVSNGS